MSRLWSRQCAHTSIPMSIQMSIHMSMHVQTLEHELSDSAGTEDWGVVKKAASAVKKHVVDPVKEHVVDPIAGGVCTQSHVPKP